VVAQAFGNEFLVGKSLKEIKDIYEIRDSRDALLKLMQSLELKGSVLYKNLNPRLITRALASPRSLIASKAPSVTEGEPGKKHLKSDRTTATFSAFLAQMEEHKMMSFEDAVRKITASPAKKFGIAGRGSIVEGGFADLVCFRGDEVKFTIVNGRVAEKESEFQAFLPGKVLRHEKIKKSAS
jgi:N-acyl-D-amino-acid deacylase